jgi:DNA-binding LytR/AlgR family response regulator
VPTALIADDEPLLRDALTRMLAELWPELKIVAAARNGRLAVESFEALMPDICFLDVHMPGLSGIETARFIGRRAHVVFVTAYDRYAVDAFAQGALDYLVKPVELARLKDTVGRLQARLQASSAVASNDANTSATQAHDVLLRELAARIYKVPTPAHTRWLRVAVGQALRLVSVDEVDFIRAEDKYTTVSWHDNDGKARDGLVRATLKELATQLDPQQFVQVHRATLVNLHAINEVTRGQNETATISLKHRDEVLPVSRTFLHQFKLM